MKKFYKYNLTILLLMLFRLSYGQLPDIVAMEYFFDTDPGYGNAISVPIVADSLIDVNFDADLSSVSSGFHILYVRVQDENGNWSIVLTEGFLKSPEPVAGAVPEDLPQITQMEYFFDVDPGYGNGTDVPIVSDSLIDILFNADLSAVKSGFHILYLRVQDESGKWSFILTQGFLKFPEPVAVAVPEELPQITQMEYFFDIDPGFGNGTDVPLTSDSTVDVLFNADLSAVKSGFHILYVRLQDENGNWSFILTEGFLKFPEPVAIAIPEELPQITQMEYFFDTDPGFGNGTDVPLTSDSLIDVSFDIELSALNIGLHYLYVRVKDENEKWSLLYTDVIFTFFPPDPAVPEQLPDIVAMEYFFDADPGFGNGTEILNTPDSIIVENFLADLSLLGPGKHLIYTRVKDENNRWSHSVVDYFCLQGIQLFLEGPYDSITGLMSTVLNDNGILPLSQPFDSNPAAEWYYDGNETVAAIPNANIVDWLLLQARDTTNAANATSATIKENQLAFLLNDGNIVGLDGESYISFTEPIVNDLYLVVFQRNHLGVMSAFPLNVGVDCDFTYSFSLGPNQVYGNESGHNELSPGVWGMISGDGNGNGQIANDDKTVVWKSESGNAGYFSSDFNMNGQVDNDDKNEQWEHNNGSGGQVPD